MWVSTYVGIPDNGKTDKLAYEATTSSLSTYINFLTSSTTFNIKQEIIKEEWQKFWSNLALSNKHTNVKLYVQKLKYPLPPITSIEEGSNHYPN